MKSPFALVVERVSAHWAELSVKKSLLNCLFPLKDRTWRRGLVCHPQGRNAVEDSRRCLRELTHGVPQESPGKGSKQRMEGRKVGFTSLSQSETNEARS